MGVYDDHTIRNFTSQTNMSWRDCRERVLACLDSSSEEVRLQYWINSGPHGWMDLACEVDWKAAVDAVAEKAPAARTRAVSMEVKDVVSNELSLRQNMCLPYCCCCSFRH